MINTAPDAPFGGVFGVPADPLTSGQVMDFVVSAALNTPGGDLSTPPASLVLPAAGNVAAPTVTRQLSLNELMSNQVCVEIDPTGAIVAVRATLLPTDPAFGTPCAGIVPLNPVNIVDAMGPREAELGVVVNTGGVLTPLGKQWGDPITELLALNGTEEWEIYNTTADAHPIHLHLVSFQLINRQLLDPAALLAGTLVLDTTAGSIRGPEPNELGHKDTIVAYPGQVTRVKATFDIAGLYVWHCHIIEHEDNEMMRPFIVTGGAAAGAVTLTPAAPRTVVGSLAEFTALASGGSGSYEYKFWYRAAGSTTWVAARAYEALSTWKWDTTGLAGGKYQVLVQARNVGSTAAVETFKSLYYDLLANLPADTVSLTTTDPSPSLVGTLVPFTALASGAGAGPYEYKFWYRASGGTWVADLGYSTTASWNWNTTGLTGGKYQVLVQARTVGSTASVETFKSLYYDLLANPPADPRQPGALSAQN